MIDLKQDRSYISRLRRDPRTKAMFDGWVAQATQEADMRFPDPRDDRERTHFAARRALELAMSHVLDNDGELQTVMKERDMILEKSLDIARLTPPRPLIVTNGEEEGAMVGGVLHFPIDPSSKDQDA